MGMDEQPIAEKKTMSDQDEKVDSKRKNVNNECLQLLKHWGLQSICDKLHDQGWSDPNDWHQLNSIVLEYEIGLSKQEAQLFMQQYTLMMDAQKKNQKKQQQQHSQSPQHHP